MPPHLHDVALQQASKHLLPKPILLSTKKRTSTPCYYLFRGGILLTNCIYNCIKQVNLKQLTHFKVSNLQPSLNYQVSNLQPQFQTCPCSCCAGICVYVVCDGIHRNFATPRISGVEKLCAGQIPLKCNTLSVMSTSRVHQAHQLLTKVKCNTLVTTSANAHRNHAS